MSDAVAPPHRAVSNLPSRDTGFVGRQAELAHLRAALREAGRVVIGGPSGVGRTALSLEYAHGCADDYDGIWWLAADRGELIGGQLAQAAYAAGLAGPDVTDPAALEALATAIAGGARWLLILDDLASDPWLPPGADVIVTAREASAEPLAPSPSLPPLRPFRPEETASLLRQRLPGPPADLPDLGGLPFAVSQAAALLALGDVPLAALTSPTAGIGIAIDRLDRDHPAAAQLLCLCAVLAASPVPVDLFTRSLDLLPGPLGDVSPQDFYGLIDTLTSYGLVATGVDGLRTHPLVQEAVRAQLGAAETVCRAYAARLVTAALPPDEDDPATWPRWVAVAPDIVDRSRRVLGLDHPDTLSAASDLAVTLTALGAHGDALPLCSDTLTRRRRILGSAHPQTLASWHSLATIRYAMGSRTEARRLYQDVLMRRIDLLGPDNPDTLRSAHSLSIALLAAGALLPARQLLDDTLDRLTHTLGANHPLTADVRETRERALVRMGGMPRRPRRPAQRRGRR